jgi:hypothetical protein
MAFGKLGAMGRGMGHLGALGTVSPYQPSASQTFDQVISRYNLISDDAFGTANNPAGANQIADATALAVRYQEYRNGEPLPTTRNIEVQRYVPFATSGVLTFDSDAMEVNATLPNGTPVGVTSTTISGAVSASRSVTVADASAINVGQVVSLAGAAQASNLYLTRQYAIRGTIASGDTVTLTVPMPSPTASVVLTTTATGASTATTLAQALVDAFNADASLTALGLFAFKDPNDPGAYLVMVPQWVSPADQFGSFAAGSVQWTAPAASKTGSVVHEFKASMTLTYVVSKSGSTLTLNHPITASNGDTLNIMPSRVLARTDLYVGSNVTVPVADTTGIEVGQAFNQQGGGTALVYVTAKTATSLTFNTAMFLSNGNFLISLAAWMAPVSQAVTNAGAGSNLSFTAVPAGVRVGQQISRYSVNQNSNLKVSAINRASSPQTVTLSGDGTITLSSGNVIVFNEPIESVQCWTKAGIAPGVGDKSWIAMELEAEWPGIADGAAWPAYWLFRDSTQPTGLPSPSGGQTEIDMNDAFNYWGNSNTTTYRPASGTSVEFYRNSNHNGSYLAGNGMGRGTRKVQLVWSANREYFYLDGVLIWAKTFTYDNAYYAQIAFNLAVGSFSSSFNANGFFPVDWSRFPMPFRIKRHRVWSAPDATLVAL